MVRSRTTTTSSSVAGPPCIAQPAMPEHQDQDAADERERVEARRPRGRRAAATARRAWTDGRARTDAASAGVPRAPAEGTSAPGPVPASARRADGEGRRLRPREPVRERARGGVLGRQLRARRPATDPDRGVVPADPGLGGRVVGGGAEVLDLGDVLSAANPRANDAGAQNRTGSAAEASTVTCRPSVGEPGRMSTATMNARPCDDPHELALRRVPLEVQAAHDAPRRARLVDLDEPGRQPERLEGAGLERSRANQPRSSPNRRGRTIQDLRDRGLLDGERHRYIITRPPSTASTWPVM